MTRKQSAWIALLLTLPLCVFADTSTTVKPSKATLDHPFKSTQQRASAEAVVTTETPTLIESAVKKEKKILKEPFSIILYNANYIMPYYYTADLMPNAGNNPNTGEPLKHTEVKYQLSFMIPIWQHIVSIKGHPISLYGAYTQLSFWQLYQTSAFFRETNYEPEMFLRMYLWKSVLIRSGFSHQSNGRGGEHERSWNRAFLAMEYSSDHWLFGAEPWILVLKADSVYRYNPDIAKYLGHELIYVGVKFPHDIKLFLELRNIERIKYFTQTLSLTIPLTNHLQFFAQVFNGYGQSLIEYNHQTTSVGVGFAVNQYF
jgi:phospholipase A1